MAGPIVKDFEQLMGHGEKEILGFLTCKLWPTLGVGTTSVMVCFPVLSAVNPYCFVVDVAVP